MVAAGVVVVVGLFFLFCKKIAARTVGWNYKVARALSIVVYQLISQKCCAIDNICMPWVYGLN